MTDTHHAPSPATVPEPGEQRPTERDDEARRGSAPPGAAASPAAERDEEHEPRYSIDSERERLVWTPPQPQYPARPTTQPPVQYEQPRVQTPPQYAPQQYAPHAQPQPQPAQPSTYGTASQPTVLPAAYAPPAQTYAALPAPGVSKARIGRRMARRAVRGAGAVGKTVFGVRPTLVVAFLVLLLFAGWLAYDKWLAPGVPNATPNAAKGASASLPPEAPAVTTYLAAIQKGDTDAVWGSLGAQEKAHRIARGDDKTVLDAVLKFEQQNGLTYSKYHYVAGYPKAGATDPAKGGMYFYVADVGGAQTQQVPMVFIMDNNGQISQVSDQLYEYVLQQLKGG